MAGKGLSDSGGLLVGPVKTPIRKENVRDEYDITKEIARGKFAVVWHARHRQSGKEFAAKVVKKRRRGKTVKPEVIHECAVLEHCAHSPYIVDLFEVFEDDHEMVLILELATGGELQQLCDDEQDIKEEHVRRIIEQTLAGVQELHKLNIVHLDIKPSNILLASDDYQQHGDFTIKLCDFGISRVVSAGSEVREILGTPDYVAPEVLNFDPISIATDMWSIGVLTYVLLTGISPFAGENNQETYVNINQGNIDFPKELFSDISPAAVDFIKRLLVKNPKDRMSIDCCRKHPWITTTQSSEKDSKQSEPSFITTPSPRKSESRNHSEILIQILPATITVTTENTDKDQEPGDSVSSPPLRRPHQVNSAEKENSIEVLTKRFKFREQQITMSPPSRKGSLTKPVQNQVTCQ